MFISNAYAQAAPAATGSGDQMLGTFLPLILLFVAMYFLMIRPQMKRNKEHKTMLEALGKGDEVVTASGMVGKVTAIGDAYVHLQIASGDKPVVVQIQKQAVQSLLPKGTIDS